MAIVLGILGSLGAACRGRQASAPALATPSATVNRDRAPLGSPIEITYKFVVANDARFDQDYRVFVHVLDSDEEMMWNDDHNPPVPTTQWKPGQTIQYTRTVFVPLFPYVGDATIQVGLYSPTSQTRVALTGDDAGQHSYRVAHLQLTPQSDSVFTVFKDGWHPAEVADHNPSVEWQWTKKEATLAFKNPKKDCVLYLDLDNPGGVFKETQQVQVSVGGEVVDKFSVTPNGERVLRRIPLKAAQLGAEEMPEVHIAVDKTFVPALLSAADAKDPRELGVRVFHAFVDAPR